MEFINQLDQTLFALINSDITHPWSDLVMQALSDTYVLAIFMVMTLFWFWLQHKQKVLGLCVPLILSLSLSDALAYRFLKPYVKRYRPCHEVSMEVRSVTHACGGDFSFPSNHASNSMAAAVSLSLFLRRVSWPFIVLAGLIGYSRIYVGAHYPSDVLGGFLLGLCTALFAYYVFRLLSIKFKW